VLPPGLNAAELQKRTLTNLYNQDPRHHRSRSMLAQSRVIRGDCDSMECMREKAVTAITSQASTITLRGVDPALRSALDAEAARAGVSLNAIILQTLRGSLGLASSAQLFHELDALAGVWSPEEAAEFEAVAHFFEEIDPALWQEAPDAR
jgi:hypothetical protein